MDRLDRKTPEELKSKFKREALSTRVKHTTLQILKSEAKTAKQVCLISPLAFLMNMQIGLSKNENNKVKQNDPKK